MPRAKRANKTPHFNVIIKLKRRDVADILCGADVAYWASRFDGVSVTDGTGSHSMKVPGKKFPAGKRYRLTDAAIRRGLQLFAVECPKRFDDLLGDCNWDAETGDLLVQLCVFGEVLYG